MGVLISVILPIYQVEKYIENSIKSICNQTIKDFEVILVNDGTKDNSVVIAEEILKRENISYAIINQENLGVSSARNTGIKQSKGDWVVCIDPDDIVSPDFLEKLYFGCVNFNTCVSFCNHQVIYKNNLLKEQELVEEDVSLSQEEIIESFLKRKIIIISPGMLILKEFLFNNNILYDEKMTFSEDQHFIWNVLFNIKFITYVKTPLYKYFIRENSTMTSSNVSKILTGYTGFIQLKEKINDCYDYNNKILPRWIFGVLRSATKMMRYEEYKILANKMNYKSYIKELLYFPDIRVKVLAVILAINLKMFYKINGNL